MWKYRNIQLSFALCCIIINYLLTAFINDKILNIPYPRKHSPEKLEFFVYPDLLQAASGFSTYLAGLLYSRVVKKQRASKIPVWEAFLLGCLFTCRVNCLNYAGMSLPYSIRALWGKLGYFSTIIFSTFLSRYPENSQQKLQKGKIKTAIIISAGAMLFAYCQTSKKRQQDQNYPNVPTAGYIFLGIALVSKGLFIDNQSYCKNRYKASANQLLCTVNLASSLLSFFLLIFKAQLFRSINFCLSHGQIIVDITLFCMFSIGGQFLIYSVAFKFNLPQNMIPLISTIRSVLSSLIAIKISNQRMTLLMTLGLVLVCGGIVYEFVDSSYQALSGTYPLREAIKSIRRFGVQTNIMRIHHRNNQ